MVEVFGADITLWLAFNGLVLGMLAFDLFVLNRRGHAMRMSEAATWSAVWIGIALAFNGYVFAVMGGEKAMQFLAGYVVEESLSVDNMFIFAILFSHFSVPMMYQPRILKWGILGAVVMRFGMIFAGAAALEAFHWIIYLFGGVILVTGVRMLTGGESKADPEKSLIVRLFKRLMRVTDRTQEDKFFVKLGGVSYATPLFIALIAIEATDLAFAIDSIPAVLAITDDVFIAYTSNIFAILGLRALYFLLAGAMSRFTYLKPSLSLILFFVGGKMILSDIYEIPTAVSLAVILGILGVGIFASILRSRRREGEFTPPASSIG